MEMNSPEVLTEGFSPRSGTSSRHSRGRTARQRRVALACQRCKRRKQRCDGAHPKCLSCSKTRNECVYIAQQPQGVDHRREHITALEERVAELEASLAFYGAPDVGDDHFRIAKLMPPHENEGDDGNEMFIAIRDLSLAASGHYVGATSNIAIGRVLNSVVQSQEPASGRGDSSNVMGVEDPSPKSMNDARLENMVNLSCMDSHTADRLIQGWHRHIATRYPIIHTPRVSYLHSHRASLTDSYDKCILNLIYAVSGRWLESAGETGYFFSDKHYDIAYQEMDSTLRLRDSRSLDYLLLMTLYCTRAPKDPGAWTYVGLAVRLCIEMGLHRSRREKSSDIQIELDKRRFWTAYFLERDICIAIGRPPSISDHDIDVELPLDVDEGVHDSELLQQLCQGGAAPSRQGRAASNLTPFIHRTRLKRIESEIQHTVYRVDQLGRVPESVITDFFSRLEQWRSEIPREASSYTPHGTTPYDGVEFYTIHYHRCVRFLLYPRLTTPSPNMHYLRLCAQACTGVISDYRRLHQIFPVGFSALSIQSVFLAGLTLIYCAWLAPPNFLTTEPALGDCQLLLYVIAERYPSAKKYRDIFERLRLAISVLMQAGMHQPGHPVALDESMQQDLFAGLEDTWPDGMSSDFTDIINTMTGQQRGANPGNPFGEPFEPANAAMSIPGAGMAGVWLGHSSTGH